MVLDTVSGAIPSCASIAARGVEKFYLRSSLWKVSASGQLTDCAMLVHGLQNGETPKLDLVSEARQNVACGFCG